MIKVDQFMDVKELSRQGVSIREITRQTGLSRNTIRKLLRGEHDLKYHRSSRNDPLAIIEI